MSLHRSINQSTCNPTPPTRARACKQTTKANKPSRHTFINPSIPTCMRAIISHSQSSIHPSYQTNTCHANLSLIPCPQKDLGRRRRRNFQFQEKGRNQDTFFPTATKNHAYKRVRVREWARDREREKGGIMPQAYHYDAGKKGIQTSETETEEKTQNRTSSGLQSGKSGGELSL